MHIEWKNSFSIGDSNIDNDHKKILVLYNKLVKLIEENGSRKEMAEVLSAMTDYTLYHFKKEEEYMLKLQYPYYEKHKNEHNNLIYSVSMYNFDFMDSDEFNPNDILEFLKTGGRIIFYKWIASMKNSRKITN